MSAQLSDLGYPMPVMILCCLTLVVQWQLALNMVNGKANRHILWWNDGIQTDNFMDMVVENKYGHISKYSEPFDEGDVIDMGL